MFQTQFVSTVYKTVIDSKFVHWLGTELYFSRYKLCWHGKKTILIWLIMNPISADRVLDNYNVECQVAKSTSRWRARYMYNIPYLQNTKVIWILLAQPI